MTDTLDHFSDPETFGFTEHQTIKITQDSTAMVSSTKPSLVSCGAHFDWTKYATHSPIYSPPFYDRIWGYYRIHGNDWNLAHIVSTVHGNIAQAQSARFHKVIARGRHLPDSDVAVKQCRAEDLITLVEPHDHGKADLITLNDFIPSMDAEQAFPTLPSCPGRAAPWRYGSTESQSSQREGAKRISKSTTRLLEEPLQESFP